ncbi:hypothetical protein [Kibdelosporangium philippinense]|uniref:hypothetical protein n=1 Tax=Kibdelosporangium philippinense TaxID=211113 RepID=UPI0036195AE1
MELVITLDHTALQPSRALQAHPNLRMQPQPKQSRLRMLGTAAPARPARCPVLPRLHAHPVSPPTEDRSMDDHRLLVRIATWRRTSLVARKAACSTEH